ncbi:MAG: nucleotidyltransferase family protein [Actinomycetota bacterium]|nr:nucleotidyltransferase family protein [Actinomycetota bacterium]
MITSEAVCRAPQEVPADPVWRKSRWCSLLQLPALVGDERRLVGKLLAPESPLISARDLAGCRADALYQVLRRHRLLPFLAMAAEQHAALAAWSVAEGIDGSVAAARSRAVAAAVMLDDELDRVGGLLTAGGLPWAPLKGAFTARRLYAHPALRPMTDLDVLVPADRLPDAVLVLVQGGYGEVPGQELNGPSKELHHPQLSHPARGVAIELHHHVAPGLDFGRLAGSGAAPGHRDLPPETHLAHRLVDLAKDGWARRGLLPYVDALRLVRPAELHLQGMWDLLEQAGLAGVAAMSAITLSEVSRDLGLPDPGLPPGPESPLGLRLLRRWETRRDGVLRIRYLPRWQRRFTRRLTRPAT